MGHRLSTDNIVWGTDGDDNIVWGTDDADNIVWGTDGDDNIVWGTTESGQVVWYAASGNVTPLTWSEALSRLSDEQVFEVLTSLSSPRPDLGNVDPEPPSDGSPEPAPPNSEPAAPRSSRRLETGSVPLAGRPDSGSADHPRNRARA